MYVTALLSKITTVPGITANNYVKMEEYKTIDLQLFIIVYMSQASNWN